MKVNLLRHSISLKDKSLTYIQIPMPNKKILFLGGAYAQIPIILEAKRRGMYIITCDYLPDNPGHQYANEYHNVSTTDLDGVLKLAQQVKPDYIVAYASDPAAPTAAYVSEKLGLPGNSYHSVQILGEKDLFRDFLFNHGFNTPQNISVHSTEHIYERISTLQFPLISKPTDSSGSKGIKKINAYEDISDAVNFARAFSRNGRVIIEEFIDNEGADIHGDGFVIDGELVFSCLGDHLYNYKSNPFNPVGTLWPSQHSSDIVKKINHDVARIIKLSGFTCGPVNIEARVNREGKYYIMEIGPRSGGHFVPQAIQYATGFDMVKASLDVLTHGPEISIPDFKPHPTAYYALHSDTPGVFKDIIIKEQLLPFIKEFHQYIKSGEKVQAFQGANAAIGVLLLLFNTYEEMNHYIINIDEFIELKLEQVVHNC